MSNTFLIIIFSAILVDNFVLSKFMGICSFLGVSKNLKTAMGMSGAVVCVMLVASAITWPIQHFLLNPLKLGYLQTLVFILVIAALVQMIEMIMKKSMPPLHKALGIKTSGSRRMAHTKEFRELEQRHPDYERAQAFIQKNAKRL